MAYVKIADSDIERLRGQLVNSGLLVMSWVLPVVALLSILRIPLYGVVPAMYSIGVIAVIVIALYRVRYRLSNSQKALALVVLGLLGAFQSFLSFADPSRVAIIMVVPVLVVSCAVKQQLAYAFAVFAGVLPLGLVLLQNEGEPVADVLRGVAALSAYTILSFVLTAHLISNKLITHLKAFTQRERSLERTDLVSGGRNEFGIREEIDQLFSASDAPIFRLYQLYLPALDISNSIYSRELREQFAARLAASFTINLPSNSILGRLNTGSFIVVAKRVDWFETEAALRKLRTLEFTIEGKKLTFDPVLVTTDAPADGKNSERLLDNLGRVLERAKRDRLEFARFLPIDQAVKDTECPFVGEVGQAIEFGDLKLYLQAKVEAKEGNRIVGAEALVRWNHPAQGLLSPASFLYQIEHSNARTGFALFVIKQSAEILHEMQSIDPEFELSFNLNA